MPRFLVARIVAGMKERKVAGPTCLYECGELSLAISVEDEGCSGQGPEVPEKTRMGRTSQGIYLRWLSREEGTHKGSPGDWLKEPPTLEERGGEGEAGSTEGKCALSSAVRRGPAWNSRSGTKVLRGWVMGPA